MSNISTLAQVVVENSSSTVNLFFMHLTAALIYSILGIVILLITLYLMVRFAPFDVHKEMEEDQNTAVGIVMGSVLLGIAIIIAAAIVG
ncbi:MAG TPA: DUF350 domain-containing protein [Caulifigura sp.]|nr:DUF350 domain-containing protein [Caulifigura sp.]